MAEANSYAESKTIEANTKVEILTSKAENRLEAAKLRS